MTHLSLPVKIAVCSPRYSGLNSLVSCPRWKLSSLTLGSLQGIYLPVSDFGLYLQMCGHIAVSHTPLGSGIREDEAVCAGRKFLGPHAAFTLLDNCVAGASIKLTACLAHKRAANTRFYACTVHFNHVLSRSFSRIPFICIAPRASPQHNPVSPIRFAKGGTQWYDIPTVTALIHG